jgi:hypothetical protein
MSTLKVNAIQNTSGVTKYLAQAWVNFNGTGTVAINGQGNVSSITDNGVGDYTVNFTTAMSDANYAAAGTVSQASTAERQTLHGVSTPSPTSSAFRFWIASNVGSAVDVPGISLAFYR